VTVVELAHHAFVLVAHLVADLVVGLAVDLVAVAVALAQQCLSFSCATLVAVAAADFLLAVVAAHLVWLSEVVVVAEFVEVVAASAHLFSPWAAAEVVVVEAVVVLEAVEEEGEHHAFEFVADLGHSH
jgi:hypothetical protein